MGKIDRAPDASAGSLKRPKARPGRGFSARANRTEPAAKATSAPVKGASAQSAAVRALNRALVQSQDQCKIAQALIEHLLKRNARLEQEFVQLMHREEQTRRLAYHDALTGLPNRILLRDRFTQAMSQAKRQRKLVAMLLIDLDGFKSVNDKLGHVTGDKLLCAVATRLVDSIRGADTACRHGGDEFVIMLPEVEDPGMAAAAAEKIRAYLSEPDVVDGYEIRMTASIGTALYPADGKSYEQLIKHADDAMYRAKARSCMASIRPLPDHEVETVQRATERGAMKAGPAWSEDAGPVAMTRDPGREIPRLEDQIRGDSDF